MKYILFLAIIYGTPDHSFVTLIKGPTYETKKECEEAGKAIRMRSDLPVKETLMSCEEQKET